MAGINMHPIIILDGLPGHCKDDALNSVFKYLLAVANRLHDKCGNLSQPLQGGVNDGV